MKISYILNRMKIDSLVMNNYGLLYMFIVENIVILMIFYFLFDYKKIRTPKKIILILDYILCVFSFILSQNNIYLNLNNAMIIGLISFNIFYFYEKCNKAVQVILAFYILNFIYILQTHTIKLLIYSNIILDLLFALIIFYKVYKTYIEEPHIRFLKVESSLSRSAINMKLYNEKLNNYRVVNKLLEKDYNLKEENLHTLLGQFKKSALLIDEDNYIINNNDIVFKIDERYFYFDT